MRAVLAKLFLGRYTRQALGSLFLMCALPLHAWTLVLAFRDLSWLTDRTNAWDALGVLSYGLVFALIESTMLFVVITLLGFLLPARWEVERRIGVMSVLVLVLSLWAMVGQLFFLMNASVPEPIVESLIRTGHPVRILYATVLGFVGTSFLLPLLPVMRSNRGLRAMQSVIERLSLLAIFYLVFDVAAVVIVVVRNL